MDRTIGHYLKDQFFIIGLLLYPKVFYTVLYILYRRKDRIYRNGTQEGVGLSIFLGGHIAPALVYYDFHGYVHLGVHVADNQIWIQHLISRDEFLKITCSKLLLSSKGNGYRFTVHVLYLSLKTNLFKV